MKIALEFSDEERQEAQTALDALDWRFVVEGVDEWLRSQTKYQELSKDAFAAFESARKKLYELLDAHGLTLHE